MQEGRVTPWSEDHEWWVTRGPRTRTDPCLSDVICIHQYTENVLRNWKYDTLVPVGYH